MENMDSIERKPKFQRASEEHLSYFIDLCRQHPQFLAGKNTPQSPSAMKDLWLELSMSLNSMRGPTRTPAKWKETLGVWKSQLRGRARKRKAEQVLTGGGTNSTRPLTAFEERALATFGSAAVDGLQEIGTLGIENISSSSAALPSPVSLSPALPSPDLLSPATPSPVSSSPALPSPGPSQMPIPSPVLPQVELFSPVPSPLSVPTSEPFSPSVLAVSSQRSQDIINIVLRSIEGRDAREEQAIQAQLATAEALRDLGRGLMALADAINKNHI